jgi:hypothetical protein
MQGIQILREYNAQAPKKTKNIGAQIIIVILVGIVGLCVYKFAYVPIRISSLNKQIANLQADLAL